MTGENPSKRTTEIKGLQEPQGLYYDSKTSRFKERHISCAAELEKLRLVQPVPAGLQNIHPLILRRQPEHALFCLYFRGEALVSDTFTFANINKSQWHSFSCV